MVPESERARRLVGLDLLRFCAIALVLGRHIGPLPEGHPHVLLAAWDRGGWVGVDLFFVLSGFLVSGLLFNEYRASGRFSIGRFYIRRGWKIYPAFLVLIAITACLKLAHDEPLDRRALLVEVFFLQSYFPGFWNHTWSLAVEEHFYIALPLLLLLLLRVNRGTAEPMRAVPVIALVLLTVCVALRVLNAMLRPQYTNHTHLFASHLRIDSLFLGVALSYLYCFRFERLNALAHPRRHALIMLGAVAFIPAFLFQLETHPAIYTIGLSLFALGSATLLLGVLMCGPLTSRLAQTLARIGAYSYSIYLWHMPMHEWGLPVLQSLYGPMSFELRAMVYVIGSLASGIVMAKLVEYPALKLRDRLFPTRSIAVRDAL